MPHNSLPLRSLVVSLAMALCAMAADAQTIDDGVMVPRGEVFGGNVWTFDRWEEYWEGVLKRDNENIGRITTKVNTLFANYGVTERLNVIADVPYVWTNASQGVLHGIQGFQDFTVAAKYQWLQRDVGPGTLRLFAVMSGSIPMTDYNPELPPLSIGSASKRLSLRGTVNHHLRAGWFANGSFAYTLRSEVQLDRPYFFTDDEFVMSDHVDMPNVFDYVASTGYMDDGLMLAGFVSQLRTLGGGDIRRQDMPFVSNRMETTRVGAMAMVPVPKLSSLVVQLSGARTITGRNVGEATTFTAGLLYRFNRGDR